ncbi:MAG: threonine synthase [Anaerolineae bacterium]|nr:threonine synthase [Anaerolineae bacterium]
MDVASALSHLECGWCGSVWPADRLTNLCPDCARPLLARYDIKQAGRSLTPDSLLRRPANLWRYSEMLPVRQPRLRKTLGEGHTPLLHLKRLGKALGLKNLYAKDEASNPTNSFKARGLVVAVNRAVELGARTLAIPTAGNAGSAMATYAALHGTPAHVFTPRDVPPPFLAEMHALGAEITLVDGLITDCGAIVRAGAEEGRWFDVSTLKEPYRIEGKKTMGYELYEHFDGALPDVVLYPTGGGTGLIGMWKAFEEIEQLGWPGPGSRPRMISVQSCGCAPVVRAWEEGSETGAPWENAVSIADGLRVP